MSTNLRPEVQRFCAAMNLLTTEVDRESKNIAEKNKKVDTDIRELLKSVQQKESQLQALDQVSKEIEAEQNCLNAPLQEYQELEMQYKELYEKELLKLDTASKRRKELITSESNECMRNFYKLQEEMNSKLELLTTVSRASQDAVADGERKLLEDTVYDLEREVNDHYKRVIESKKAWNERLANVYGTDKKHRDAVIMTMNGLIQRLRNSYITSKLQMHKLKAHLKISILLPKMNQTEDQ